MGVRADGVQAAADTQQPPPGATHSSSMDDLATSHEAVQPKPLSPLALGQAPAMGVSMAPAEEGGEREDVHGQGQQLHEVDTVGDGQPPSSPVYLPGTPTGELSLAPPLVDSLLCSLILCQIKLFSLWRALPSLRLLKSGQMERMAGKSIRTSE